MAKQELTALIKTQSDVTGVTKAQGALNKFKSTATATTSTVSPRFRGMTTALSGATSTMSGSFGPAAGTATRAIAGLTATLGPVGVAAGLAAGAFVGLAAAAAGLAIPFAKAGAEYEKTQMQFEVMMGDSRKAIAMLNELNEFANVTPFANDDIIRSTKTLMGFGVTAEQTLATTKMLGDIASISGKPLNELALIYGKAFSKGKVEAETLNQISEAGVPILQALASQYGVTKEEIYKMCSEGKLGASDVQQAFIAMTSEGGQYFNGMVKQSETASGLWSTLTGKGSYFMQLIGNQLMPVVKQVLNFAIEKINKLIEMAKSGEIMNPIIDGLKTAYSLIKTTFLTAKALAQGLYASFMTVVRPLRILIDSIVGGLSFAIGGIIDAFWGAINGVLKGWNWLMEKIGQSDLKADLIQNDSTSQQYYEFGNEMFKGAQNEFNLMGKDWDGVRETLNKLGKTDNSDPVIAALDSVKQAIKDQQSAAEDAKDSLKMDKEIALQAPRAIAEKKAETSGLAAEKINVDRFAKIGLYGAGGNSLDTKRNALLEKVVDILPSLQQQRTILA